MSPPRPSALDAVDEYLADVPPRFRSALQRVRRIVRAAAPQASEVISYRMPAFRLHGNLVYYGAFKDHCSLFVGSAGVRRKFAAELKPYETGKGTLQFTPENPLPTDLISRIVKFRVAENEKRSKR